MKVTTKRLERLLGLEMVDPCSANCWVKKMYKREGIKCEEFELTLQMKSPIYCTLLQPDEEYSKGVLVYVQEGIEISGSFPWLKEIADKSLALLVTDLGKHDHTRGSMRQALLNIWRIVSYLSLRNDLVDPKRILYYGKGDAGVLGLYAAILDERIRGLVAEGVPLRTVFPDSEGSCSEGTPEGKKEATEFLLSQLATLVAPRSLAVLNCLNPEGEILAKKELQEAFRETRTSYDKMASLEKLRLEKGDRKTLIDLFQWMVSFE